MPGAVIDASVAVKWFLDEDRSQEARHLLGAVPLLLAPSALFLEVVQAVWNAARQKRTGADAIVRTERELQRIFPRPTPDLALFADAARIMREQQHPIYDCLYLALAERSGFELVTADERQFAAARRMRTLVRLL